MRKNKNITIIDNGNEIKFKITALSAMQQQRWLAKAFTTLATAVKMSGAGITQLNEQELENTFESIKALVELEKECFNISFDFFQLAE